MTLSLNLSSHTQSDDQPAGPVGPFTFATLGIIMVNLFVFCVMFLCGVPFLGPNVQQVLPWGANLGPLTMSGQWWRLITACFLHFGIVHLGLNMYVLFRVGIFTEIIFGKERFLLLYLLAGVGGNIAGLYFHPLLTGAGASGAVFGVYGGLVGFLLIQRGIVPKPAVVAIVKSSTLFIVINLVYSLASPQVDLAAHVGGLLSGFAIGALWAQSPIAAPQRNVRTLAVTLAAVLIAVTAFARAPRSSPSQTEWYRQSLIGPSITVGNQDRVAYGGAATKADADAVGKMAVFTGILKTPGVTILFDKDPGGSSISIPLRGVEAQDQASSTIFDSLADRLFYGKTAAAPQPTPTRTMLPWADPAIVGPLKFVGPQLALAAGGPPLTIRLLNTAGELRNEVRIDTPQVQVGTLDLVTYSGEATVQEARALGGALQSLGFFKNHGSTVALAKSGGRPAISFNIKDSAWDDPRLIQGFELIVHRIAPSVGEPPFTVHLINIERQTTKDFAIK